ncbi:RNA-binding protein, partial [Staphylococcus aureus]|nr:RNA-binding protein [Staphylococcus aureus]
IFDLIVEYYGELPIWDKTRPQANKEVFKMSKCSFNRAIGNLYKKKIINIKLSCRK